MKLEQVVSTHNTILRKTIIISDAAWKPVFASKNKHRERNNKNKIEKNIFIKCETKFLKLSKNILYGWEILGHMLNGFYWFLFRYVRADTEKRLNFFETSPNEFFSFGKSQSSTRFVSLKTSWKTLEREKLSRKTFLFRSVSSHGGFLQEWSPSNKRLRVGKMECKHIHLSILIKRREEIEGRKNRGKKDSGHYSFLITYFKYHTAFPLA